LLTGVLDVLVNLMSTTPLSVKVQSRDITFVVIPTLNLYLGTSKLIKDSKV